MKIFTEAQLPYPVALEKVACMGTYIMLCAKLSAEPVSNRFMGMWTGREGQSFFCLDAHPHGSGGPEPLLHLVVAYQARLLNHHAPT